MLSADVWLKAFLAEPQFFLTVTSPYFQLPPLEYPFLVANGLAPGGNPGRPFRRGGGCKGGMRGGR